MTGADLLTALRVLAVAPIAAAILLGQRDAALVLFALAAASDALDGPLARRTAPTAYGALLDPLADKVLVAVTLVALGITGAAPAALVALVVLREGAVTALRLAAHRRGDRGGATGIAKAKTACEMIALVLLVAGPPAKTGGVVLLAVAAAVGWSTLPSYATRARRLA